MTLKEALKERLDETKPPKAKNIDFSEIINDLVNDEDFIKGETILICHKKVIRTLEKDMPLRLVTEYL